MVNGPEPPEERPMTIETLANELEKIKTKVARLTTRDAARRRKMLSLQAAVIKRFGSKTCLSDDIIAPVFPIEHTRGTNPVARILAFGSMGDNLGMTTTEFFRQLSDLDVEVYFLKDFEQVWYMKGLLGLTTNIDETLEYLSTLRENSGVPFLTLGASSGGFAALLFGNILQADRILAFSPQTEVTKRVFSRFSSVDSDVSDFSSVDSYGDLVSLYNSIPYIGEVIIYYAERAALDAQQAVRMGGFPSVTLKPLPWGGHNTAQFLQSRGLLKDVLTDFVLGKNSGYTAPVRDRTG